MLSTGLGLTVFLLALWSLHGALAHYRYQDIVRGLAAIPAWRVWASAGLAALGYLSLGGYDFLALRYAGRQLPVVRTSLTAFIANSIGFNIGVSSLGSGAIRYRFYSSWGISGLEVARIIAFCSLTFWLGFLVLTGSLLTFVPFRFNLPTPLTPTYLHVAGLLFLALSAAWLVFQLVWKKPFGFRGLIIHLPGPAFSLGQIVVSCLDLSLAASALYVLLPPQAGIGWVAFLGLYLMVILVVAVSNVPGGLFVLEYLLVNALAGPAFPATQALGVLLVFRAIYYILPLLVAALSIGVFEFLQHRALIGRISRTLGSGLGAAVPNVLAFTTFLGGLILLFSGATPELRGRLGWLNDFLPLPVLQISHFVGSLIGAALLFLARGIQRRLDGAWLLTVAMLTGGIVFSLAKGLDYEEAVLLAVMLIALLPCREQFYRRTALLNEGFTTGWITAILLALAASTWLGLFSYKHVEYSHDLWWKFDLNADAPRFLRASVGAAVLAVAVAVSRLIRHSRLHAEPPSAEEIRIIRPIVADSHCSAANLALLGDKTFLLSESGAAFLMYGVQGKSWITLGDPVGPVREWPELLWSFRELADRQGARPVFYEAGRERLELYLDLGLAMFKIGENARVHLPDFTLEGVAFKGLRHARNAAEKDGCSFEILPPDRLPPVLPRLRQISDSWLEEKNTREKGFSLGFFSEDYLLNFPCAVVRLGGEIVAFANVFDGGRIELSADLMRYQGSAPPGVMEYLFIELMLWGRQNGYTWFDLGMAPLSGLESRPLAPAWNRLGAFLFRYGAHFYNFGGLRTFKQKFHPEWTPRYLACPGGLAVPAVLTDIGELVSGGLRGIFAK